jgi:hypothetical protein
MQRCLRAHWQFMIVLKDKDLPTVWEEFRALRPRQLPTLQQDWGRRQQHFSWVNDIEYAIFGDRIFGDSISNSRGGLPRRVNAAT